MQNVATSPRVAGRGGGPGYLIETDWADRACVLDHLIGELTVGETSFFREPEQFELIRRQVLPELRRLRHPAATIQVLRRTVVRQ